MIKRRKKKHVKKHDYVRFTWDNEVRYGEVHEILPSGKLVVYDAVLLVSYELVEDKLTPVKYSFEGEYYDFVEAEFNKAQAASDALPDGLHVGALFGIGVADGTAWYVVTKVNKKTCDVEWRGFCPDHYYDRHLGGGRKGCPLSDIEPIVRRGRTLNELFGGKATL
jgi:hypothetical protein